MLKEEIVAAAGEFQILNREELPDVQGIPWQATLEAAWIRHERPLRWVW